MIIVKNSKVFIMEINPSKFKLLSEIDLKNELKKFEIFDVKKVKNSMDEFLIIFRENFE